MIFLLFSTLPLLFLQLKVIGKLGTVTARIGVADSDQQSRTQWHDLNKSQKLGSRLELEPSQKLVVKVAASDSLHQVFILLRCKETKKEVAFIAQSEADKKTDYKLELVRVWFKAICLTLKVFLNDVSNKLSFY